MADSPLLLDNGSYTRIDVPGIPTGINASGQMVGSYTDAQNKSHGFLLNNGTYTTFDVPGSSWTFTNGINASGHIVGYYEDAGGQHGFLATPVP
jgi:probable HAF family extracellular repeat protein